MKITSPFDYHSKYKINLCEMMELLYDYRSLNKRHFVDTPISVVILSLGILGYKIARYSFVNCDKCDMEVCKSLFVTKLEIKRSKDRLNELYMSGLKKI